MVVLRTLAAALLVAVAFAGCTDDPSPAPADTTGTGGDPTDPLNETASEAANRSREAFLNNTTEVTKDPPPPVPPFNEISERVIYTVQPDGAVLHLPIRAAEEFDVNGISYDTPDDVTNGNWAAALVPRSESLLPGNGEKCRDVSEALYTYVRGGSSFSFPDVPAGDYDLYIHGEVTGVTAELEFNRQSGGGGGFFGGGGGGGGGGDAPDPIEPNMRKVHYNVTYLDANMKENNGDGTHYTAQTDVPGSRSGLFIAAFSTNAQWMESMEAHTELGEPDKEPCYSDSVSATPDLLFGRENVNFRPDVIIMPGNDLVWTAETVYGSTFSASGDAATALFHYNGNFDYGPFWLDRDDV